VINVSKEASDTHIKTLKEEILADITKKIIEKILEMVNQNVQHELMKFQDTKNEEHEMIQKQRNSERTSTNTKVKQRTL
jgi:hypothetical protein